MALALLHSFAAFAEMERGIIRERVCAGVRAAKAKGTRLGRPQRVFRRADWRVCWLGGWTRDRLSYLVMVVRLVKSSPK
jgi:hypothetical protein